ncbi:lipopolysaccharide assembly protein LapB [Dysgonomonas sp. 25]|uniref:tetratricopeptide repeat protein n=1 Tax=Dysgonomonas sp. 25 TaxID=2302933 RepID=UPI0013D513C5|nr:hypothetical protein [Dysgonomonas sp. 25]NDV67555.1 hypothetical protein [Dysgonomonas sp. 25]
MKRIFLVASLCLLASGATFAQKKAVKDAKAALGKDSFSEARELIKPALTNPETANDPEAWKIAGDIEFKAADKEIDKEKLKEFQPDKGGWNEAVLYEAMYNLYAPYLKADELGELPDEKGKKKNKVRKDIVRNLKIVLPYYPNAGIYYNSSDRIKSSELFEMYWNIPQLPIFTEADKAEMKIVDSTYQIIKYYATITAIQAEDKERSIRLLKRLIDEPYYANNTQKESDPYELLASQYYTMGDTVKFMEVLELGASKFPENNYFVSNLISEYISAGKMDKAMDFVDKAIANGTDQCMFISVKASLFADKKEFDTAEQYYNEALSNDANCQRALEGLGLLYALRAQEIRESAYQAPRKEQIEINKKAEESYLKALPLFEKLYDLQKANNDAPASLKKTLQKLENVYYNLEKAEELAKVQAELETLKYD